MPPPKDEKKGLVSGMGVKKIRIEDNRKISSVTGKPIKKSRTGEFDPNVIKEIVKAAKAEGVDPYDALAIAMQESAFGTLDSYNLGQVEYNKLKKNPKKYEGLMKSLTGIREGLPQQARALAYMLKQSQIEADEKGYKNNEPLRLQAYNGYGKIGANNDIGAKELYGIDLTKNTIDMTKTPLYGKSIIDVRDNILKKNNDLNSIVNFYSQPTEDFSDVTVRMDSPKNGKRKMTFLKQGQEVKSEDIDEMEFENATDKEMFLKNLYTRKASQPSGMMQGMM